MQDLFLIDREIYITVEDLSKIMEDYNVEIFAIESEYKGYHRITFQGTEENILKLGMYLFADHWSSEDEIRKYMRKKKV